MGRRRCRPLPILNNLFSEQGFGGACELARAGEPLCGRLRRLSVNNDLQ